MTRLMFAAISFTAAVLSAGIASAEEVRVLSSVGIKAVVEELAPQFEKTTKHKVTAVFDLASAQKAKIEGGERFDVAILTPALRSRMSARSRRSRRRSSVPRR